MKKIIRIASVIALASASLLYVGCTKDFSADIAKTNQDVAALNQKIETLNSTVQTINGTVESLKTTKADLSAVNAADQALDGKITALDGKLTSTKNDLTAAIATAKQEAIDAASADAASKLAAAKTELEGVIKGVKAKVDSLEAFTVAQTDSLRKDVDSLYANCEALEARIAALEGRVDALAARITSIVAVPSMYEEFQRFIIDTVGKDEPIKDTAFFSATFAVTPKAAVKNINAEDLKVNFKKGLTRARVDDIDDTTLNVTNVIANEKAGEITVFVALDAYIYPYQTYRKVWDDDENNYLIIREDWNNKNSNVYYSLQFAGKDEADADYEENSEYVKAHENPYITTIWDAEPVKVDGNSLTELTEKDKKLTDTLAFNDKTGNFGKLLTTDCVTVAFNISGKLLSAAQFAELVGADINVEIDSAAIAPEDTVEGFKVTRDGTKLDKATFAHVGNHQTVNANGFKVNGYSIWCPLEENHYIGAKTVEFTLPAISEPWTYTSWDKVSRTVSITDCKDVHDVVPTNGIEKDAFKITKDSGTGVNIAVTNAQRNEEAKDTVYNVVFTKKADISATPKDTVNITINWKYTLEGRPADKTIDLADVDTLATGYTSPIKVAIDKDIVAKTFREFDAAYDKAIDTTVVKNAIKAKTSAINTANVYFEGDTLDTWTVSDGKVVVPAHTKAGAYEVELEAKVFGIKYTYTYTINLKWKEKLYLHATPYVSAGVAKVDADTTAADGVYTLKEMDMAKYLQVFNADTLAKGFDNYKVKFKTELEDSTYFANEKKDTSRGSITLSPNEVKVKDGVLETAKLDWSNYKGRKVKVTAYLVIADTVKADSCTFTLQYEKPIRSFSAGTQTIKRVAGKDASAVLAKSFNIKGLYNGDKNLIVDTTGAWINGKNYYGCEIKYNIEKASFKVNGETATLVSGTDFEFAAGTAANPETAKIKFFGDNNNKNIEASIPVTLTYKYDYNNVEAYKDNVVIKVVNE